MFPCRGREALCRTLRRRIALPRSNSKRLALGLLNRKGRGVLTSEGQIRHLNRFHCRSLLHPDTHRTRFMARNELKAAVKATRCRRSSPGSIRHWYRQGLPTNPRDQRLRETLCQTRFLHQREHPRCNDCPPEAARQTQASRIAHTSLPEHRIWNTIGHPDPSSARPDRSLPTANRRENSLGTAQFRLTGTLRNQGKKTTASRKRN